jgi:hypothetical protein
MSRRPQRIVGATAALALLGTLAFAAPAFAVAVTWSNTYGGTCFGGTGAPNGLHTVSLLEGATVIATTKTTAAAGGYFGGCFPQGYRLEYGYKLKVQTGSYVKTVTIPNLGLKVDRVTDVVSGRGFSGKPVRISVTQYAPGSYTSSSSISLLPVPNASGIWTTDLTGIGGIRGNDSISLTYKPNEDYASSVGDTWNMYTYAEAMLLRRGSSHVSGTMNLGEIATITLKTGASVFLGKAGIAATGENFSYSSLLRRANGAPVYPVATNKVTGSFATDANVTIPNITVNGAAATDVVSGACMASQGYYVFARKPDYSDSAYAYGTTSGTGAYSTDLTSQMNLAAGDYISVTCKYDTGDQVMREGVSG